MSRPLARAPRRKPLGALLARVRSAAGLTQADAARLAGIDRRRWHDYETGASTPDDATLAAMLRACDVAPDSATWVDALRLLVPAMADPARHDSAEVVPR